MDSIHSCITSRARIIEVWSAAMIFFLYEKNVIY